MKKLIVLLAVLGSVPAFAEEAAKHVFNFTYWGSHMGGYTMVTCDYAERQAEELYMLFGAERVRTTCTGGIQPNGVITPISLRVSFVPVKMSENMRTVRETFRDRYFESACDFNSRLVRGAVRTVKNVKMTSAFDHCMGGMRNWEFRFKVKLPQ